MHYRAAVLTLALAFHFGAASADNSSRPASFSELFGIDQSQAESTFGAHMSQCLADALADFNLALAGETPLHSSTRSLAPLSDGGTDTWHGECFELTIYKSLTSYELPDGTWVHGHIRGPSLRLKFGGNNAQSVAIARTQFVLLQVLPPNKSLERTRD
jgi:hypothetical protein